MVDKYLINKGLIKIEKNIDLDEIERYISHGNNQNTDGSALKDGFESYNIVLNSIINLKNE